MVSNGLELAGLVLLSVAAFMLSAAFGVAVAGISCLLVGFAFDRKDAE